ncbi:MAG TPA: ECF-type sigma factor [Gemmataceae bacterium]|jgi:RNA polymerase sigma factor (TIGR02999 family)|nr:ECF-type sigma factor [Gemmataceae bacterium]
MADVTQILNSIEQGDPQAAEQLLPLVYEELRRLAAAKLAAEAPGHTLEPTALVHEAYLRLVPAAHGDEPHGSPTFANRAHFFAAAAESMRRILVENARRKKRLKRGGNLARVELEQPEAPEETAPEDLMALDEALNLLAQEDPVKAELVKLRFFAGLSSEEAAECLGISRATAARYWTYARAWLYARLRPT